MRCRVTYQVEGSLKLGKSLCVTLRERRYELRTTEGLMTSIVVDLVVEDNGDWPTISESDDPRFKLSMHSGGKSFLPPLQREMEVLEGLLCFFGLERITTGQADLKWVPETQEEKDGLQMYSFSYHEEPPPTPILNRDQLGLTVQFVLSARRAEEIEIPLSFYKNGFVAFTKRRHFEAITNWYFMFETLFGDGKWRKAAVRKAFLNSQGLVDAIDHCLAEPGELISNRPLAYREFTKRFAPKSSEEIVDYLIELRGLLHHHSLKRPGIWDPDKPYPYETDARFIHGIAFRVAMELAMKYALAPEVQEEFRQAKVTVIIDESDEDAEDAKE